MKKIQYIDFQYKKNAKLDKNEILKLKKKPPNKQNFK